MTNDSIGPGLQKLRDALARGEDVDVAVLMDEYPDEELAIADEGEEPNLADLSVTRELMWLARAEVEHDAGRDASLGATLRRAREYQGVSAGDLVRAVLARGANLDSTTLEGIEANQVVDIDPAAWAAVAAELDLDGHQIVASIRIALAPLREEGEPLSGAMLSREPTREVADYLDRVRSALGIPTAAPLDDVTVTPGPARAETPAASPVRDLEDVTDVQAHIDRIFNAQPDGRAEAIRQMFVEVLDFNQGRGPVPLSGAPEGVGLPSDAERVAELDGVHVVYVALDSAATNRVRRAEVSEAARLIASDLGDDLLLVFTDRDVSQLQLVLPDLTGSRPTLRRMVVERYLPQRTAVEQIARIYRGPGDARSVPAALAEAFDVEPVTRRFFAEYKRVFEQVEQSVTGFAAGEDDERRLFVQTLFNRLMFVYFLQRKGWLDFRGDKDYLKALWSDHRENPHGADFHTARLRNLFFVGLNNPDSRDLTSGAEPLIGTPPFLNGGLFEEGDLDKREGVTVSDEAIEAVLTDLFERFNFTVMESTPFDIEVAVDPEMLGKVFEELVTGRHDSGAYYTPRPVVSFMCREALKRYLSAQAGVLSTEAIAEFVDEHRTATVDLPAARRVAEALNKVTVVDPACGSGAYLLGMMQELVELQDVLYNAGVDAKKLYDLKLEIIQHNLYGVDIDEFAVNIARLRLWLSLAIEYDGAQPEPLPNLDFKILLGDSLLAPGPSAGVSSRDAASAQMAFGRDPDRMARLDDLKGAHLRARRSEEKDLLVDEIEQIRATLREGIEAAPESALDWRVEFAEVFGQRGGFDIAIANPPYGIRIEDRRSTAIKHSDSYTNFLALATEIAPLGVVAYITPASWETGERFVNFRKFLFSSMALRTLVNLPYDVFAAAYVDTAITIGTVGGSPPEQFMLATFEKRHELDLSRIAEHLQPVAWSVVGNDTNLRVPLLGWASDLFLRIARRATRLDNLTRSRRGIEAYKYQILERERPEAVPFFLGQLHRYEIVPSADQRFVVVGDTDASYHTGPRILTRRIVSRSNRLMSALAMDAYVVKKDLYAIKPKVNETQRLIALLAILNSSLVSFLYLSRSASATKDDFRQVTLSGLRELPIIFPSESSVEAELVRLALARSNQQPNQGRALDQQIDQIVYRTYGVDESEQAAIEEWLARSG